MIIHTVTFRLKHASGSLQERDFLAAGIALGSLPMVRNFKCHNQVSTKNNFTHGFYMEFASDLDYQAYNDHPEHTEFVTTRWLSEVDDFLELDYTEYCT